MVLILLEPVGRFQHRENAKRHQFSPLVIADEEASVKWSTFPPLTLAFSVQFQPIWTNGMMPTTPQKLDLAPALCPLPSLFTI